MMRVSPRRLDRYKYLRGGYGSIFHSEALPGALPPRQNNPQHPPYGLYPELLSGTAFTLPREKNRYSWLYRILPSVRRTPSVSDFQHWQHPTWVSPPFSHKYPPTQFRFKPSPPPAAKVDFVDGAVTMAAHGSAVNQDGCAGSTYAASASMADAGRFMVNYDADMLLLPQEGGLEVRTEFGHLEVEPCEMALVPRGMAFQVNLLGKQARGYFLENFGSAFVIPDLGPIGISSGLAHPRHFQAPQAAYEEVTPPSGGFEMVTKLSGDLWRSPLGHSPFNVVAWYGSYLPFKYDLRLFMAIDTATYDHPDPSINTVMSSYTATPGLANVDFVVFPPKWQSSENTFRPPWFHRNYMSELMGLIYGTYDAKPDSFKPGAVSIHNRMVPHGPDGPAVERGTAQDTSKPERLKPTMAFMWETRLPWHPSEHALATLNDADYPKCWGSVTSRFDPGAAVTEQYSFDPLKERK